MEIKNKLEKIVIHTTDTPYNREVLPDDIYMWHLGVRINKDKTYTYLGETYSNKNSLKNLNLLLPSGKRINVLKTNGRGWKQVGYSDMILRDGSLINLVPYNFDDTIDSWEITNGATGHNRNSRHIVLVGGWTIDGNKTGLDSIGNLLKPEELYTKEQLKTLLSYLRFHKNHYGPDLKITGHNKLAKKTCPNFDVELFLSNNNL